MWARIGVRTMVEAPCANFIGRATRRELAAVQLSWGNPAGKVSVLPNSVPRTPDRECGHGATDRVQYANPRMD